MHVNAYGAELKGVEMDGLEYLWQGDKDSYPRTSPTLFPIVGRFLSDTYYVGDQAYHMNLNGIVQDENFRCISQTENQAVFQMDATARTRISYPYDFRLTVTYTAEENCLEVGYRVENRGNGEMPFGLGCHTAYRWPLFADDDPRGYRLLFEKEEDLESFNPFGWRQPFVKGRRRSLSHSLFENCTRGVTGIRSQWVEFGTDAHGRGVRIWRVRFPFLAIWSLPDPEASLICLEPCTSMHAGDRGCTRLDDREGSITLPAGKSWEGAFRLEFL